MTHTRRSLLNIRLVFVSLLIVVGLGVAPRTATADPLDDMLEIMVKYGGLDPAIEDAHEMLRCLVDNNGDATECFDLPTEAEKQAGKAAGKFMPDDPKIQAVVDLILAAQQKRWFKVIEIAGMDVTLPLLCDLGTGAAGPVGKWVCGAFRDHVLKFAKPLAKEIFSVLTSGDSAFEKLLKMIALVSNLDLACDLIPVDSAEIKGTCSFLAQIITEIGGAFVDAGKYGAKLVVNTADEVENLFFGNDAHMPYDRYYGLYWLPWLQKSVDLCITSGCQGAGKLNGRIWDACVDYFDSHNQYRSTAKKTCSDMRDKRYIKTYTLLTQAITVGAKSYPLQLRAGAQAWAITEYGKNNHNALRSQFLALCEAELEQGYPIPTNNPAMCDGYKLTISWLPKEISQKLRQSCLSDVAAQQVVPTPWRNACKKAEPDFIALLQSEQQTLQGKLTELVMLGCQPPNGWTAAQGLRFQCQTYTGYDECRKVMVVGANSICNVDRNKADAARAKEILGYLGTKRCSLNGTEILCHRPWKHTQCKQLVKVTQGIQLLKSALTCSEESADYFKIAFANQALLENLNKLLARAGQSPSCSWTEDKAKILCLRPDILKSRIAANPELDRPSCSPDPNYDGSDVSCFLLPYDIGSSPQHESASITPSLPAQVSPAGTIMPAGSRQAQTAAPQANVPARTAAPAIRALNAQAPPNPCRYEATYYEPQAPIIESSSPNFQVGDQIQIRCAFAKKTRRLVWEQCDAEAQNAIQILKAGEESGSRYSGLFVVDGATIGVASSPLEGGDFDSSGLWTFNEAGVHSVACLVDNGLRPAEKDGPVYLESAVNLAVHGAAGEQQFRIFNPDAARRLPVQEIPRSQMRREPQR